ncbi:MAG: methyltransferase domain-containing protein [Alkalispirochaeta sp.]
MDTDSTEPARKTVLISAEHRRGHGSGHLYRCARLVRELDGEIDWLLPEHGDSHLRGREEVMRMVGISDLPVRWIDQPEGPYDIAVLDQRSTSLQHLHELNCRGIVIGIDVAGEARSYVHYAVDTLEPAPGIGAANITDTGLLHLPERVRDDWPEEIRSVLVVFGGEGSDDEAVSRAREISAAGDWTVTVVTRSERSGSEGVRTLTTRGALPDELHRFDVVVTHFGLTAYEATWARVPVILLNPSAYHERLARSAGFVTVRTVSEAIRRLSDRPALTEAGQRIRPRGRSSLAHLINDLSLPHRTTAPVTGARFSPAIERFGERTFFREDQTDLMFMQRYRPVRVSYDHDYFFSDYQKQYGKTYLEDFPHIKAMGERRLADILNAVPHGDGRAPGGHERPRLLDVGCAYGPFLQAAAEGGMVPTGLDISQDAVSYVERELGFAAYVGDIRTVSPAEVGGPFDIVTMWYVIEHFPDLDTVLDRVSHLIHPGGLFAFSTPNARGISGRRNVREFLRQSPDDHYTIMDRRSAGRVLEQFGLQVVAVRFTGHHPERFGLPLGSDGVLHQGARYRMVGAISRLMNLGDTFEVIAKKE